jgi:hypothetical protein
MSLYSPNHSKSPLFPTFSIFCLDVHNSWVKVKCQDPQDPQDPRFTFRISNTTFGGGSLGCGAICAGQHCGLGGAGRSGWPVPRWPVKMGDWSYWSLKIWHHMAISRGKYGDIWLSTIGPIGFENGYPWIPHIFGQKHVKTDDFTWLWSVQNWCRWPVQRAILAERCWLLQGISERQPFAERSPCHTRSWSRIISYN